MSAPVRPHAPVDVAPGFAPQAGAPARPRPPPQAGGQQQQQQPSFARPPPPGTGMPYSQQSSAVGRPGPPAPGGHMAARPPLASGGFAAANGYARPAPGVQQQQQQQQQQQRPQAQPRPQTNAAASGSRPKQVKEKEKEKEVAPGPFAPSLTRMMYGFGDHESPANDTVHVMEDLLGHFVTDLCTLPPLPATHATSKARQVTFSHLHHRLASHPSSLPLLHRLEELAILQKDIKEARKTMDPTFSTGMGGALAPGGGGPAGDDDGAGGLLGGLGQPVGKKRKAQAAGAAGGAAAAGKPKAPSKKKKKPAADAAGGGGETD